MKKLMLSCVIFLICSNINSQSKQATTAEIQRFKTSTTYVVLEENPFSVFNATIQQCMPLFWKITPYKIISVQEFDKLRTDPSKSFIYISYAEITKTKTSLFDANTGLFDNVDQFRYNLLNLILGDKSGNLNKMADLASLPLSYVAPISKNESEDEEDEIDYSYKLGGILRLMQFYVNWSLNNPSKTFTQLMDEYTAEVSSTEIWVTKEDLAAEANSLEKIAKVYPFKVKIVTATEIENAIKEGNSSAVFLHKIGPEKFKLKDAMCFLTLINCADGKPYYFNYHKVKDKSMDGIMLGDFKKLIKK
ncbi:MAG: hypothetical protein WCP69_03260 [Bacteroidota bacterium]